jgi:hypothetical protein
MRNNYIIRDNFSMKKFKDYDKIGIYYNHLWRTTIALMSNEGITLIPILPSSRWIFADIKNDHTLEKYDLSDHNCIRIIGIDTI